MHRKLTTDEVKRIARLSNLRFTEEELDGFTAQFDRIVEYVERLNEVDCSNVEPMTRMTDQETTPREDSERPMLSSSDALRNSPARREGFFSVPKVIGDVEE